MPQLDKFTYFTQFFWSCIFFFTFYILICNDRDGVLGISRILKLRNQLLSHRAKNIQSKDPNSLEDLLRKGFNTGISYMYSSLFEVSQWCKSVDLLGNRNKRVRLNHNRSSDSSWLSEGKIRVWKLIGSSLGTLFGIVMYRFLGSEITATINPGLIVLLGFILLGLSFIFRLIFSKKPKKSALFNMRIYLTLCFFFSIFLSFLRIYLSDAYLTSIVILGVSSGAVIPHPGPSGPESSWSEDSDSLALIHYDPPHSRPSEGSNQPVGGSVGNGDFAPRMEEYPRPANNPPLNGLPLNNEPLPLYADINAIYNYRAEHVGVEVDLINRIQILENRLLPLIPPQESNGGYEALVQSNLASSTSIDHYKEVVDTELFDLRVLELKGDLVEGLTSNFLKETDARFLEILEETFLKECALPYL